MPVTSPEQFAQILSAPEGTKLEFKAARTSYEFDKLVHYCVALANEGGGTMILGVTDKRPRDVLGTTAFPEPGETEASLHRVLQHRIPMEEFIHEGKRILLVHVPSRLPGTAWQHDGKYLKRAGDALVPMADQELRTIFAETGPDFTALPCDATIADFSPQALAEFRKGWLRRTNLKKLEFCSDEEMLTDAELLQNGRPCIAALILFGTRQALGRHLAQCEIVFEYRSSEASGPAADRHEYREGFLSCQQNLWDKINLRNDRQSYQEDFFRYDIPTFDEQSIREAIVNAVAHRDYRLGGSIFIRQFSRRLEVISPGGFPPGITLENIADQQNPRNRRLAEALARCGLIERSGQGVNLMIENAIRQTKPLPDFTSSASHEVRLILAGTVQHPAFIRFLERLGEDQLSRFSTYDYMTLDAILNDLPLPPMLRNRIAGLVASGAVESQGRGRGSRYYLSRELYKVMGNAGIYTRKRGLDHGQNKELLLNHLKDTGARGAPIRELLEVLPALSRGNVKRLLQELAQEKRAFLQGKTKSSLWFAYSPEIGSMANPIEPIPSSSTTFPPS